MCLLIFSVLQHSLEECLGIKGVQKVGMISCFTIISDVFHLVSFFGMIIEDSGSAIVLLSLSICLTCIAALAEDGKLLLAARRFRRATCNEYVISLHADDLSKGGGTCIGKLRFVIHINQTLFDFFSFKRYSL